MPSRMPNQVVKTCFVSRLAGLGPMLALGIMLAEASAQAAPRTTFTVLYNFGQGASLSTTLVQDAKGNLYGTTMTDGGSGSVFKMDTGRNVTTLYYFTGSTDGRYPNPELALDDGGNLYGTTSLGHKNAGAVYMLTPPTKKNGAWTETTLYTCSTDSGPFFIKAGVILDKARNIYGTSETGGPRYLGNVFKLKPPAKRGGTWTESELHRFRGGNDGRWPFAGLMFGKDGALYGTTLNGGGGNCLQGQHDFGCGTVFKLVP